jgi:hypothetical protein
VEAGRKAAHLAALNALAVLRQHLGSLDRVSRIVRLSVSVASARDFRDHPKSRMALLACAGTSSEKTRTLAAGVWVASLPLGVPVELEFIFEIAD